MLLFDLVVPCRDGSEVRQVLAVADIAERDECVPPKPSRLVPRHVEPGVVVDQLAAVRRQPLHEVDVTCRDLPSGPALADAAVPRTHVLADVAAVDLRAEGGPIV